MPQQSQDAIQSDIPHAPTSVPHVSDDDADRLQFELDMVRSQLRKEQTKRRFMTVALTVCLLCMALMVIGGGSFAVLWFTRAISSRDSIMHREFAMVNAQQARMMEVEARKQAEKARLAAELAKQKADELLKAQRQAIKNADNTRKEMLAKLVKLSLDDAEQLRTKLQKQLSDPAQKNKLLNDPRSTQAKLNEAGDALRRARLLLNASGEELDPGLAAELYNLRLLLKSIESELKD